MNREFNKILYFGSTDLSDTMNWQSIILPSFEHDDMLESLIIMYSVTYKNEDLVETEIIWLREVMQLLEIKLKHFLEGEIIQDLNLDDIAHCAAIREDDISATGSNPAYVALEAGESKEFFVAVKYPFRNRKLRDMYDTCFPAKELSELKFQKNASPYTYVKFQSGSVAFAIELIEKSELQHYGLIRKSYKIALEKASNMKFFEGLCENMFIMLKLDKENAPHYISPGAYGNFRFIKQDNVEEANSIPCQLMVMKILNESPLLLQYMSQFNMSGLIVPAWLYYAPFYLLPIIYHTDDLSLLDLPNSKVDFELDTAITEAKRTTVIIEEIVPVRSMKRREDYVSCGKDVLPDTTPGVVRRTEKPLEPKQLERIPVVLKSDRNI